VYLFHFSDGENGESRDTDYCMDLLRRQLLPKLNLFCFGQVRSSYGAGASRPIWRSRCRREQPGDRRDPRQDEIYDAIKKFLARGYDLTPELDGPGADRGLRARVRAGLLRRGVRAARLRPALNEVAAYGASPRATRTGASAWSTRSWPDLLLGPVEDLRAGDQQQPVYAYLMKSNAEVEQKLVMAHVLATPTSSRTTSGSRRPTAA